MRFSTLLAAAAVLTAGCSGDREPANEAEGAAGGDQPAPDGGAAGTTESAGWDLQSSGEGVALALLAKDRGTAIRLFCAAGSRRLLVNVPSFRPIGSEERLSFGSGGDAVALVADPSGDAQRGGVTGRGPVPANLSALISGPVSASYGAQTSGPHPAPPANLASDFAAACSQAPASGAPRAKPQPASACLTQDGKPIPANRLRAVGTEPFWAARIEGRCVTYSHPDDQKGTRVWTRFSGSAANGSWTGSLGGSPFILRTRPQPGCSDGMSDNRYPIAVALTVGGEQRTGCADPL